MTNAWSSLFLRSVLGIVCVLSSGCEARAARREPVDNLCIESSAVAGFHSSPQAERSSHYHVFVGAFIEGLFTGLLRCH